MHNMEEALELQQIEGEENKPEEGTVEKPKKISLPEAILALEFTAMADLIKLLVTLTGIGIIAAGAVYFVVAVIIQGWLFFKGARGLGKFISMLIPVQTFALLIVIYLVNHEAGEGVIGKAMKVAKK